MSWQNEVRDEIEFISPYGSFFDAYWRRNPRSREKKLGIFNIPKFDGDIVQDMGVKSNLYPLTIFFEGPFHHFFANRFMEALKEPGQWQVTHPVEGALILQPIKFQESVDSVEENVTEIQTEWIEPANIERLITPDELISSILSAVLVIAEDATTLLAQLRADAYALVNATVNVMNSIGGFMDNTIQELTATSALLFESYQVARAAFNSALAAYGIGSEPDDMAAALTDMATIPTEVSTSFSERYEYYDTLSEDINTLVPAASTREDFNTVVGVEFGTTLSLLAVAQITATSEFNSRSETISAAENLISILSSSINAIEAIQDNFTDLDIERQYYSNTATYTSLINTYTLCLQYLIQQTYNLRVEKVIKLQKNRSPLEITVTEYGSLGQNDENYDLFLSSNELTSNEILLLNAGREVVVYV
jgi:hypothetical protein